MPEEWSAGLEADDVPPLASPVRGVGDRKRNVEAEAGALAHVGQRAVGWCLDGLPDAEVEQAGTELLSNRGFDNGAQLDCFAFEFEFAGQKLHQVVGHRAGIFEPDGGSEAAAAISTQASPQPRSQTTEPGLMVRKQ